MELRLLSEDSDPVTEGAASILSEGLKLEDQQ